MYEVQYNNGNGWRKYSTTCTTGNDSFLSLLGKLKRGEIEPGEAVSDFEVHNYESLPSYKWRLIEVEWIPGEYWKTRPLSA